MKIVLIMCGILAVVVIAIVAHSISKEIAITAYKAEDIKPPIYLKDEDAKQCFCYGWVGTQNGGPIFTSVPCTPEVEKLVTVRIKRK